MVGVSSAVTTRSPRRRRRITLVLVAGVRRACFTWRRRSITLGDLLAGAKDVPSGCTVACILFVHFVHTVKASRKASPRPGARTGRPGKSTYVHVRRRRSLFLHVRASPKRRLTYTWTKKDLHENHLENRRIISRLWILWSVWNQFSFPLWKSRNWMRRKILIRFKSVKNIRKDERELGKSGALQRVVSFFNDAPFYLSSRWFEEKR